MDELTPLQRRVLAAIRRRVERGVMPPTYRDLCAEFGWASTGTARDHLRALARKGHLELGNGCARGLRLTKNRSASATSVRVLGEVAAGTPVGVEEVDLGRVPTPADWGDASRLFALRVAGDSMRDGGILHDDVVVIRRQQFADDGDVVVATLGGGTTLKHLRVEKGRAFLTPDNPSHSAIPVREGGVVIQGVVVGLLRRLGRTTSARSLRPS